MNVNQVEIATLQGMAIVDPDQVAAIGPPDRSSDWGQGPEGQALRLVRFKGGGIDLVILDTPENVARLRGVPSTPECEQVA